MRILFMGEAGKAGRHMVPYLMAQGHRVVLVDKMPLEIAGVDNLIATITESGLAHWLYAAFSTAAPARAVLLLSTLYNVRHTI